MITVSAKFCSNRFIKILGSGSIIDNPSIPKLSHILIRGHTVARLRPHILLKNLIMDSSFSGRLLQTETAEDQKSTEIVDEYSKTEDFTCTPPEIPVIPKLVTMELLPV